jgi:hypothetical protein
MNITGEAKTLMLVIEKNGIIQVTPATQYTPPYKFDERLHYSITSDKGFYKLGMIIEYYCSYFVFQFLSIKERQFIC